MSRNEVNERNDLIIRSVNTFPSQLNNSNYNNNTICYRSTNFNSNVEYRNKNDRPCPNVVVKNNQISINNGHLPQIAIKRKDNDTPGSMNTEVVLLNGNWDTSNKIPNIIAEMHNVNIEELQALQNTLPRNPEPMPKLPFRHSITPSPQGSDSGIEGDSVEGNLSWLLNYKIHELPPVPDSTSTEVSHVNNQSTNKDQSKYIHGNDGLVYIAKTVSREFFQKQNIQNVVSISNGEKPQQTQTQIPYEEGRTYRYSGPEKPPFTYTELIEYALTEKGELTVSGIYQWISDHFPFYKQSDDRWKNSIRHNLSINPHFRKGCKSLHGAGHLWTIANHDNKNSWNMKKQKFQQISKAFCENKEKLMEKELETATASILSEINAGDFTILEDDNNLDMNGKRQRIEVEYVNLIDVSDGLGDFLCPPVSKEQVAEECGLTGDYLITDLNPNTLGLNIAESELINSANLYDDLNFQCYELQGDQ